MITVSEWAPRALDLIIAEAGDDKPSAEHLEIAILKLQLIDPSTVGILTTMNESIVRLSSMILAHVYTADGDVNEAMKELYDSISTDIQAATKGTKSHDEKLPKLKNFLDKQVSGVTIQNTGKEPEPVQKER